MTPDRRDTLNKVKEVLLKADYTIAENTDFRFSCFDIVARKGSTLLLLKIHENVDAISEETSRELKILSRMLLASPIIIGNRTRKEIVQGGLVYERQGLPAVSSETFERFICENVLPLVFARRGGLYVKIDGDRLRREREKKEMSFGDLASSVGVSRRTIYEYERGYMDSTLETALKLEEVLDIPLAVPINIISWMIEDQEIPEQEAEDELQEEIRQTLRELGLKVVFARKAPFDALTADQKDQHKVVITGLGYAQEKGIEQRIISVERVSQVAKKFAMFVIDKDKIKKISTEVPVISKEELQAMEEPEDLFRFIYEKYGLKNRN
ncbi:MAG: transcriptional regulator [Candidatus Jordarchaeaceae archaeon]